MDNQMQPQFSPNQIPTYQPSSAKPKKDISPAAIFFGFTTILFISLTVFFMIRGFIKFGDDESYQAIIDDNTIKVEKEIQSSLGFYVDKIDNKTANSTYRIGVHRSDPDGNGAFGAYINEDNQSVEIYVYWRFAESVYGVSAPGNNGRETFSVPFAGPVSEILIGGSGQSVSSDVLLFLLQDGTVEYMPIAKALTERSVKSYGKLGGLENVVKFYQAEVYPEDLGSGHVTTLAQRTDGSIVDLRELLTSVL